MERSIRSGTLSLTYLLASAGAGGAAWLVALGERPAAGIAVAASGLLLVWADAGARRAGAPRLLFTGSLLGRASEAAPLAALVWALLPGSPRAGAAAVAALAGVFVADYVRVKATGLGFRVRPDPVLPPARMGMVALGLLLGWVEAGLWAAAGVSLLGGMRDSLELARQSEPA